jgi:predicted MPP superfamily phosphohydrolase
MSLRKLSIQIYSDLHLELTTSVPKITPRAPYLFLAGDISRFSYPSFKEFLKYCNQNWEKTFYVFGNHDYWNQNSYVQKIKRESRKFLEENQLTNIHILDNNFVSLNEDIIVLGSTFWTHSPFIIEYEARMYINDYNMIRFKRNITDPRPYELSPRDVNQLNFEDTTAIYNVLNENELTKDKKVIVMTHFPPQQTNTSHSKYDLQGKMMKNYFSHPNGTIKDFNNTSNILCWISGHTHYSYDFVSPEGVRLISNQMGYIGEVTSGASRFKENGLFEIEY